MSVDKIQKMYDEMYNNKYNQLVKEKEQALSGLSGRDQSINNQYTDTQNAINTNKTNTANKYQDMYTGLNNDQKAGTEKYYQDRNAAAVQNARQTQAVRENMARNNLLQSGENVDAQLRGNTDFNNNIGRIYSNEQTFNRGIEDTRNRYKGEEQSAYTQYDNQLSSALKERDRMIAELQAERDRINNGWSNNVSALQSEINFNKIKDIQAYEEQIRREQWQAEQEKIAWDRQMAARSYSGGYGGSSGGYGGSSGGSYKATENQMNTDRQTIANQVTTSSRNMTDIQATKNLVNVAAQYGIISPQELQSYTSTLNNSLNNMKKSQATVNKGGYSNKNQIGNKYRV